MHPYIYSASTCIHTVAIFLLVSNVYRSVSICIIAALCNSSPVACIANEVSVLPKSLCSVSVVYSLLARIREYDSGILTRVATAVAQTEDQSSQVRRRIMTS